MLQVLPGVGPALGRELARAGLVSLADSGPRGDAEQVAPEQEEVALAHEVTPDLLAAVGNLRCAVAGYAVLTSPERRPSGLLATPVTRQVRDVLDLLARQRPRVRFTGLRLEAAGSETPLMHRVAEDLAALAGVPVDTDGDLLVRVRRAQAGESGWELLIRTTPRPLATRAWRTERYPGALNATIAAAVVDEVGLAPSVADLMCGSGTLTVERLARREVPVERGLAVDLSPDAGEATRRHLRAARLRGKVEVVTGDVLSLGLSPEPPVVAGSYETILCNPPWGELLGEHETNESLYAGLLDAVDRLGSPGVRAGILTHDIRRFERVLEADARWRVERGPQYFAKGHRPRLYLLTRA